MLSSVSAQNSKRADILIAAGFICGCGAYFICAPLWLLKTRSQAGMAEVIPPTTLGYWVGCSPLVLRGALLSGGQMLGYDGTKSFFKDPQNTLPVFSLSDGPTLHVISAIVAAFFAATLSAPADVTMCRMQTGGVHTTSLRKTASHLWMTGGPMAFFRGWTANFCRLAPT